MAAPLPSKNLSDLIGRIYDCALDPVGWEPALEAIRVLLQCQSGQLFLNDLRQHRCLIEKNVGVDSSWLQAQHQYLPLIHARMETWHDGGHSIDEALVVSHHLSPATLASSPYFQEWYRPQGLIDVIETTLMWSPTRWSGLCFRRHERMGAFGEQETDWMRLLAPHLRRAVTISNILEAKTVEIARMAETLDALKLGVVLTSAAGYCISTGQRQK